MATQTHVSRFPNYHGYDPIEIVDLQAVQCVVGHVKHDTKESTYYIIDRSGALADTEFVD